MGRRKRGSVVIEARHPLDCLLHLGGRSHRPVAFIAVLKVILKETAQKEGKCPSTCKKLTPRI